MLYLVWQLKKNTSERSGARAVFVAAPNPSFKHKHTFQTEEYQVLVQTYKSFDFKLGRLFWVYNIYSIWTKLCIMQEYVCFDEIFKFHCHVQGLRKLS